MAFQLQYEIVCNFCTYNWVWINNRLSYLEEPTKNEQILCLKNNDSFVFFEVHYIYEK